MNRASNNAVAHHERLVTKLMGPLLVGAPEPPSVTNMLNVFWVSVSVGLGQCQFDMKHAKWRCR